MIRDKTDNKELDHRLDHLSKRFYGEEPPKPFDEVKFGQLGFYGFKRDMKTDLNKIEHKTGQQQDTHNRQHQSKEMGEYLPQQVYTIGNIEFRDSIEGKAGSHDFRKAAAESIDEK